MGGGVGWIPLVKKSGVCVFFFAVLKHNNFQSRFLSMTRAKDICKKKIKKEISPKLVELLLYTKLDNFFLENETSNIDFCTTFRLLKRKT